MKKRQLSLFEQEEKLESRQHEYAEQYRRLVQQRVESQQDYEHKKEAYNKFLHNPKHFKDVTACNLFTYAFFQHYKEGQQEHETITGRHLALFLNSAGSINARLEGKANAAAQQYRFFHWPLEFPDVFEKGGFDVLLGNPPWERIKLQEKEFFAEHDPAIANAPNAAARKRLIGELPETNPGLYAKYLFALHESEASSKFIRESGRFPLTGRGDINTYSIFSEVIKENMNPYGNAGFVVPTGIATDDTNKYFFADLVENEKLVSLFDFENRKAIFPNVHRSYKFALITLGNVSKKGKATFGFFLHDVLDIQDKRRIFELTKQDFLNINPNTKTTPIFRTRQDAELTAKIYSRVPVLINEAKKQNPWGVSFLRMFDMSNDSHLFRTEQQLREQGFELKGNRFVRGEEMWLPLYEGKMCYFYNHRAASVVINVENIQRQAQAEYSTESKLKSEKFTVSPNYWINKTTVKDILINENPLIGFKSVTSATNERTFIPSFIPYSGVGNSLPVLFTPLSFIKVSLLVSNLSSLLLDFIAKQKIGGVNLNYFYINQFAILDYSTYKQVLKELICKIQELVYASWDIKAFADNLWQEADEPLREALRRQWEENKAETGGHPWQVPEWADAYPEIEWERDKGCPLPPFKWDEGRRARLKAELDAYYSLLYGLTHDELRYILDPQEVYGEDFPGETFRVLKEKEIRKYGEYRTRRLVLEAYDRLAPGWDMEAHLKRLKEVWEKYQEDLSPKKEKKKGKTKTPSVVREPAATYGQTSLFEDLPTTAMGPPAVQEGSKVVIKNQEGKEFKYHLLNTIQKGSFTGEFKHIATGSNLAAALLGKKAGDKFAFGGMEYEVVEVIKKH